MPMRYSPAFRALMIQKTMTDPDGPSPISLADEIGVSRNVSVNPSHLAERPATG